MIKEVVDGEDKKKKKKRQNRSHRAKWTLIHIRQEQKSK